MIRSLAEQLVSEANAVLHGRGVGISLIDDTGACPLSPDQTAFLGTHSIDIAIA